jgi:hypothetical protein
MTGIGELTVRLQVVMAGRIGNNPIVLTSTSTFFKALTHYT